MIKRLLPALAGLLGPVLLGLMHLTIRHVSRPRRRADHRRDDTALRGPVIFAFWHQVQLIPAWRERGTGVAILVSRHGDGELISRVVERLGFHPVRGSSTRGGVPALKQMIREVRSGRDAAFTPDGPRGPRFRVHPGLIQAASLSGAPIRPVGYAVSRVKRLRSWDRFLIPLPFSRGLMWYGPLIHVPRDLDRESREEKRLEVERELRAAHARAWREIRRATR